MNIFNFNIALILVISFLFYNKRSLNLINRDGIYLFVVFILLFIIHAFKNPYSLYDIPSYIDGYKEIENSSLKELWYDNLYTLKAEKGYIYFNKFLSFFSSSSLILLLATSFIILIGYYVAFKRYSAILWLSVFLFVIGSYNQSLYVLRQHMAMSILLFSYPYIIQRKFVKFFLIIIMAFSLHQSAIIFFPIFFIYGISSYRKIICCYAIGGCMLYFIMQELLIATLTYLNGYESYILGVDSSDGENGKMSILLIVLFGFRYYVMKRNMFNDGIDKLLTLLLVTAIVISIAGIGFVPTSRMNLYYTGMICLIFPNTIMYIHKVNFKWFSCLVFCSFLLFIYEKNLVELASMYQFL